MSVADARDVFLPAKLRRIPARNRRAMFSGKDPRLEAWVKREVERCTEDLIYFVSSYGSIEPPVGDPIPFKPWSSQIPVLRAFLQNEVCVILKARRLGLSWLALHLAAWVICFAPWGPGVRVLIICKNEDDAKKLLDRVKRICKRLPFYLRPDFSIDNTRELQITQTGCSVMSLPATDRAARQETAALFILDEFAFPKDGAAHGIWTAVLPTIEGGGRGIVISTGNGRSGDGGTFATIFERAWAQANRHHAIFLPWHSRPDRTKQWYEAKRLEYITVDDFLAEYPATIDEALLSSIDPTVYPYAGVAAAEALGDLLDGYAKSWIMQGVEIGGDWGDFQTNAIYAVGTSGGGLWVVDELVQLRTEPVRASRNILDREIAGLMPGIRSTSFDSNPPGSNRTFADILRAYHEDQPSSYPSQHITVPFSEMKEGGAAGRRGGVNTIAYLSYLFANSIGLQDRLRNISDPYEKLRLISQTPAIIAISPRCKVLLHQLRELKRDPQDGKVQKSATSPHDPLAGDHGPDALVAVCAGRAARFRATMEVA